MARRGSDNSNDLNDAAEGSSYAAKRIHVGDDSRPIPLMSRLSVRYAHRLN
jgi:hypothetical protein